MRRSADSVIENDNLRVAISSRGGEIRSVRRIAATDSRADSHSRGGETESAARAADSRVDSYGGKTEFIWQGDPSYWAGRAINLFPYIGRMTGESYFYRGGMYSMDIHGFLKDSDMDIVSKSDDAVTFRMCDDAETRRQYPFSFIFEIRYRLSAMRLDIGFHVKNTGGERMYFGLGGHPGFCVPLADGENFEDYYLEFPAQNNIRRIAMSKACFTTDAVSAFPLRDGAYIDLKHELFDDDAIVLENTGGRVLLKSGRSGRGVMVYYPDMRYLGLWHKPRTDAPFLCIEPWTSLPSREGVTEDISRQENLIALKAGEEYSNLWNITII